MKVLKAHVAKHLGNADLKGEVALARQKFFNVGRYDWRVAKLSHQMNSP